jgi:hypothetical protein
MGFTSAWWTQLLGDLNGGYMYWWTQSLGDLNGVYIILVDTAPWGPKLGLHRFGGHSCLGTLMGFTFVGGNRVLGRRQRLRRTLGGDTLPWTLGREVLCRFYDGL